MIARLIAALRREHARVQARHHANLVRASAVERVKDYGAEDVAEWEREVAWRGEDA